MKRTRSGLSAGWDSAKGGLKDATKDKLGGGIFGSLLDKLGGFGTKTLDSIQEKGTEFSNSDNGGIVNKIMKMIGGDVAEVGDNKTVTEGVGSDGGAGSAAGKLKSAA
jgi:hypothetical protein